MTPARTPHARLLALPVLGAALAAMVALAASMGFIHIPVGEVLDALSGRAGGGLHAEVVLDVRLPRILCSVFVGFGLAMSGAVFQALLRNPLADPFTLGVSSGAAFGASLALLAGFDFLGASALGESGVALSAFAGAALTLGAVLAMTGRGSRLDPAGLILSGIILASILSAGLSFIKYLADERVSMIVFWLLGSFASKTWTQALLAGGAALAGFCLCLAFARDLNVMGLGENAARSLGVDTGRVRLVLLLAASLVSAVCVAVSGIIGFVGLIVPHLMRMVVGPDNRLLLPASGLAGGMLLLAADTVTRAWLPHEVPIGVLTALMGGPVFCWIFRRMRLGRDHG